MPAGPASRPSIVREAASPTPGALDRSATAGAGTCRPQFSPKTLSIVELRWVPREPALAHTGAASTTSLCWYVCMPLSQDPAQVMSERWAEPLVANRPAGADVYGTRTAPVTLKRCTAPSWATTWISSPACSLARFQNTAGPVVQSRCPSITASPASPGAGPGLYQATWLATAGPPMLLCWSLVTDSTVAFTPMLAITSRAGTCRIGGCAGAGWAGSPHAAADWEGAAAAAPPAPLPALPPASGWPH